MSAREILMPRQVCSVLAVETLHTAFNLSSAYKPLVIGFGRRLRLAAWRVHLLNRCARRLLELALFAVG